MSMPYFPMYPTDFEAKTSHLTLEEDGAYNRLLRLMWMTPGCSLPEDANWICRRMRVDAATFARVIAPLIEEFFKRQNGRIFSPRLREEFEKADVTYKKRSEAGKKGGRPKAIDNKQEEQKAGLSQSKAGPKQPEPEPEPVKTEVTSVTSCALPDVKGPTFDQFWAVWPLAKQGKKDAAKAFAKLSQQNRAMATERVVAWASQWKRANPRLNDIHPSSYLNGERWSDEIQPTLTLIPGGTRDQFARDDRSAAARTDALRHQINVAAGMQRTPREDCF